MVNDMTGTLANSKDDYERPDRVDITAGRPYGDPYVKMNTYGVGIGRASFTEAISNQRNGFNIKHGSQNYPASKSVNVDPRLLTRQNIAGRSSNVMPNSWKNSGEEEFMWEMHSRLSQQDAANISNNSMKDHWILDVSEKLDFDSPLCKAQSIHDVGSSFDRETSSDSLSIEQKDKPSYGRRISSAWPLQELHKIDGLSAFSFSHSESYSASIGGHHYSLSQQPKLDPVQVESSGQTQKPLLSQISEVGTASIFGNAKETNPLDIGTLESSSTSNLLTAVMKGGIISKNSLIDSSPIKIPRDLEQVPSQPSLPSQSLLAIFTLPGLASHDAIAIATNGSQGKLEQLLPSSLVNSTPLQTSDSKSKDSIPVSNLLSSLVAKGLISASKKATMSAPSLQIPTQMQKSLERERTTESLNKSLEISTSSPSPASSIPSSSDAHPRSSTMDEVSFAQPATKSSFALHHSTSIEVENLIGLEFRPDLIREFHLSVISGLLDNLSHCCGLCGLRLMLQVQLNRHLEWHAMKKAESKSSDVALRGWYPRSEDWIAGKPRQLVFESIGSVNLSEMTTDEAELIVPADESQYACLLCGELFEDFFSQERGEWMFKGAIYLTIPSKDGHETPAEGPIVHANCMVVAQYKEMEQKQNLRFESQPV
ncbi:hypothetical protein GQ457_01G015780 [Hibiscus cannabinus]